MKPLVVVYLKTWATKKVAEAIADVLECDIEKVFDIKKKSCRDADSKKLTTIEKIKKHSDLYDVIMTVCMNCIAYASSFHWSRQCSWRKP